MRAAHFGMTKSLNTTNAEYRKVDAQTFIARNTRTYSPLQVATYSGPPSQVIAVGKHASTLPNFAKNSKL